MCAINGITKEDRELVVRMNERTEHRGPDGTNVYSNAKITLGHNRLAIIDTTDASAQPMHSSDKRYSIVFNGEIYNYKELKAEIRDRYTFETNGDTEVLLAAYVIWGMEMFPKLKGVFAFAIWDNKKNELILARDHMGVKPLYYTVIEDRIAFSSEIPGLLEATKDKKVDLQSLSFYLSMEYVPSPKTLVEGVQKLKPGHTLTFQRGSIKTESFLEKVPLKQKISHEYLYDSIDRVVKRQMVSDRSIGAFLSGGFDSSIVVHHMSKYSDKVNTYSVGYEGLDGQEQEIEKFNQDADLAEKSSQFFGTNHKKLVIPIKNVRSNLERILASVSEPVANPTIIAQDLLSDFARKDGTVVVLGGDGGDELFGGYTRHRAAMATYIYQKFPLIIQKAGSFVHPKVKKLMTPLGTPFHQMIMTQKEETVNSYLNLSLNSSLHSKEFFDQAYQNEPMNGHPLDRFMRVDRKTWLPDESFIRSDFTSMAHGVEYRVPLTDKDLVHVSDKISPWQKTLPHEGKIIIKKAYEEYLPPHLYNQPKRGWISPAAKWFRDPEINKLMKEVFSNEYYAGLNKVFDWKKIHYFLNKHVEKESYNLYPLWNIFSFQIWARANKVECLHIK